MLVTRNRTYSIGVKDSALSVSGSVTQTVSLHDGVAKGEFLVGLRSGLFVTSIGRGENNGRIYRISGGGVAQEVLDDTELAGFEAVE